MKRATVATHARLHLGFLDLDGGLGRTFGSIGMALDQPAMRIVLAQAADGGNRAAGPDAARALRVLDTLAGAHGISGAHDLAIEGGIPAHVGLGSGTQLALAVAAAFRRLHGIASDTRADALLLRRGARSGIGAALFDLGGVVVDGGQGAVAGVPPVLARHGFPPDWCIVLLLDRALEGIHGEAERAAFANLPPFSAAASAEICRLVLVKALPGLVERDIAAFGSAIARIQAILGDHFAPAQGGRFTSPRVTRALDALMQAGVAGGGQSSWGPAGFAFVAGEARAREIAATPAVALAAQGLDMLFCKGRNAPADISLETFEEPQS